MRNHILRSRIASVIIGAALSVMPMASVSHATALKITIKTLTAKAIQLDVDTDDTIKAVKEKLEAKEGYPASEQRLIYHGQQLEDAHTLADYKVSTGDTLHLVMRLRGG
ncbi:MAG: ubiquitin-like protein [Micropepsaceae bacterium]